LFDGGVRVPAAIGERTGGGVEAAIEMLEATARYEQEVGSPLPLALRIGINTV